MKKSNRRKLHITAIVIFIFFVCSLVGYSRGLKLTIQQETIEKVNLVAAQNKENVSRKLTFSMQQIRGTKNQIMDAYYSDNGFDKEGLIACLKSIEDRQNFINMGIVLKDGTLYSSQDLNVDMYHSDYIQKTFNDGQIHISDTFINRVNQKLTIVLSDAIIQNNEVIGVVYIAYAIEDFRDVLSVSSFDGTGYSYIIKEDGTAIMDSTHEGSFVDFQNLYTSLKNASPKNEDCIAQLKAELGKKAQGHFIFHNKIDKYCAYTSLGINDWYLLTVVPRSYVDGTSDRVVFYTALLYVVLIILFGFLSFLTYHFMRDKNKELEKMLFEDKVTHMISYEKFMIDEQEFIESLKADEKAAYMYLDIENFKLINDLYGFEYGDQALQYIAYILSDKLKNIGIFARMYADHFIVLISYKNKTELLDYVNAIHTAIRNGYKSNTSYILKPTLGIYEIAADNKEDFEFMHNCAKIAHTSIKKQKDKMYAIYTDDMRIKLLKNKSLEDSIIKGIDMDEFIVYYQPKYDTITKKIVGSGSANKMANSR